MGMFDSFFMKVKCPYCGNIDVIEFQTKQFDCMLNCWNQGDEFKDIQEGIIKDVYGGCIVKNNPDCGLLWELNKYKKRIRGFGRSIECDILIKNGKVHSAINVRKGEMK